MYTETDQEPWSYSKMPLSARADKNLKPNAKILLGEILSLAKQSGYAYARNSHYMNRIAITEATVINMLKNLEDNDYIRRWYDHKHSDSSYSTYRRIYPNYAKLKKDEIEFQESIRKSDPVDPVVSFEKNNLNSNDYSDDPKSYSDDPKSYSGDYKDYSERLQKLESPTIKVVEQEDITNYLIKDITKDIKKDVTKDDDSETKVGFSKNSQQAETSSSKDNRPNGLSAPSVADVPVKIPINESVVSKNPKSNYDFSFSTIQYLASRESNSYKKTASLYPNKDNINDAVRYFAKVASVELNIPELREEIKNLPATESREFLEYLEFKVKQKRAIPIS